MSNNQRMIKLPYRVLQSVLKTEAKMDKFLAKQAQKWEAELLA